MGRRHRLPGGIGQNAVDHAKAHRPAQSLPVFRDRRFTLLLPESEEIFAYTRDTDREHLLVVCNFTPVCVPFARPEAFRQAELLISNYSEPTCVLRPYEAQMFYREASGPEKGQARKA